MAARLPQLDVLNLLRIMDDEPVEERHAKKLVSRGLCYTEGREVFVTVQGQNTLKKMGIDHEKMKGFGKSLASPRDSYDPLDHLSDWTLDALEVRAAQTQDPRVLAEIDRRERTKRR